MSQKNLASSRLTLICAIFLLSACSSTSTDTRIVFQTENNVKNHLKNVGVYNSYPLELLIGPINSSQFSSVDIENVILGTLDLTRFGETLRDDLAVNILKTASFRGVSKDIGEMYLEGNVLEIIASNSFSCGGWMVESTVAVSILPYIGGKSLWDGQYSHSICFKHQKYNFETMPSNNELFDKAFSILSKELTQIIANGIGQNGMLMFATESQLDVNVYSPAERAMERRREIAFEQKKLQLEKERAVAEKARVEALKAAERERAEAEKARVEAKKIAEENMAATIKAEQALEAGFLNVIGIHPSITTEDQFKSKKESFGYIIGGYELFCTGEFEANVLYKMSCLTGEKYKSKDRVSGNKKRLVDNIEVHNILRKGFQEKYGVPKALTNQVRNGFGVKFQQEFLTWRDAEGNELLLISTGEDLKTGSLSLESYKAVKDMEKERIDADNKREF